MISHLKLLKEQLTSVAEGEALWVDLDHGQPEEPWAQGHLCRAPEGEGEAHSMALPPLVVWARAGERVGLVALDLDCSWK